MDPPRAVEGAATMSEAAEGGEVALAAAQVVVLAAVRAAAQVGATVDRVGAQTGVRMVELTAELMEASPATIRRGVAIRTVRTAMPLTTTITMTPVAGEAAEASVPRRTAGAV